MGNLYGDAEREKHSVNRAYSQSLLLIYSEIASRAS